MLIKCSQDVVSAPCSVLCRIDALDVCLHLTPGAAAPVRAISDDPDRLAKIRAIRHHSQIQG